MLFSTAEGEELNKEVPVPKLSSLIQFPIRIKLNLIVICIDSVYKLIRGDVLYCLDVNLIFNLDIRCTS